MFKYKKIKGRKQTPGLGFGKITDELYKAEEGISEFMIPKKTSSKVTFYEQPEQKTSKYVQESMLARPSGFNASNILENQLKRVEKNYTTIQKPLLNLEKITREKTEEFFDEPYKRMDMLRLRSNATGKSKKSKKNRKSGKSGKNRKNRKSKKNRK